MSDPNQPQPPVVNPVPPVVVPIVAPAVVIDPSVVLVSQNIDKAVQLLNKLFVDEDLSVGNIMSLCINVMQLVETFPGLTGEQKKHTVLQAMSRFLESKGGAVAFLAILPDFIDRIVSVNNGDISLDVTPAKVMTCCSGVWSKCTGSK